MKKKNSMSESERQYRERESARREQRDFEERQLHARHLMELSMRKELVRSRAEFSDPIRKSGSPITRADVAETMMDIVDFGKGREA